MRYTLILVLALGLGGCAWIHAAGDFLFGTNSDGTDKPGPSPAEGLLGLAVPWGTAAGGIIGTIWAAYRSGKKKDEALGEVLKAAEGSPSIKTAVAHAVAGKPKIKAVVDVALAGLGLLGKSKTAVPAPPSDIPPPGAPAT